MALISAELPAHFDVYPYYFIGLMSVGGHASWWGRSNCITTCYSERMKFPQQKQAVAVAKGLIDSHNHCDIFVCMVAALGTVSTAEMIHQYRLTNISDQPNQEAKE